MPMMPAPIVEAAQPRGLRYGLLTAATGPLELPPHALASGIRFKPVSCGGSHTYAISCPTDDPEEKVFDPDVEYMLADSTAVYATLECSRVGSSATSMEDQVRQRLFNGEQFGAETLMAASLAAAAVVLVAPDDTSSSSVVGELEEWLYGSGGAAYGNVGFLHVPVRYAADFARHGLLIAKGPVWTTAMGTVVVFGGGYPDDGKVYISGNVTVWRATDVNVPPAEETWDQATNTFTLLAEREYAVAFDCHAASVTFDPDGAVS